MQTHNYVILWDALSSNVDPLFFFTHLLSGDYNLNIKVLERRGLYQSGVKEYEGIMLMSPVQSCRDSDAREW